MASESTPPETKDFMKIDPPDAEKQRSCTWREEKPNSDEFERDRRDIKTELKLTNDADHMVDMTHLTALLRYYIDLVGRYKLSSQARSKTEAARSKALQEAYEELHSARQEAMQKKEAEKKRMLEEAEAELSAESLRKKEAKERARPNEEIIVKDEDGPRSLDSEANQSYRSMN